jgi:TPR repeat protein
MRFLILALTFFSLRLSAWNGEGVVEKIMSEANPNKIEEWKKLADSGDVYAQSSLGLCYARGDLGIAKDEEASVFWHQKAAKQGSAYSQCCLAQAYQEGKGVTKNPVEGTRWLRLAAENGDAPSQYNQGNAYARGEGVLKDEVEAVKWYRISAKQGFSFASFAIGLCYFNGRGVIKNKIESYAWLNISGVTFKPARTILSEIEKEMTPSERIAAQKRSKELLIEIEDKAQPKP